MGIRKPGLSVGEARRLAETRTESSAQLRGDAPAVSAQIMRPSTPAGRLGTERAVARAPETPIAEVRQQVILGPARSMRPERSVSDAKRREKILMIEPLPPPRPIKSQVFLMAPIPAEGVSPIFELLCRQYTPSRSLQMILRRAMDVYEQMLADGSFRKAPRAYVTVPPDAVPSHVQTSRMLPPALLAVARTHFDPLGLESGRVFGRKLAMSALAVFFSAEIG